jgi:uncharacterized protein
MQDARCRMAAGLGVEAKTPYNVPSMKRIAFLVFRDIYAVCKLDKDASVPGWAYAGSFISITRTPDELSIICAQNYVPEKITCERGWRCLQVQGSFDFSTTGIIASFAPSLADAGISIIVVCTYNTDYLLVQEQNLDRAIQVLSRQEHQIEWQLNKPR